MFTFVGGGNMGSALVGGMLARGRRPDEIRIVEPLAAQREKVAARFSGVAVHPECDAAALGGADLVVFAVKPQQMQNAARAVAPHLAPDVVVLSIAAGIRIEDLARWLGGHRRIVRAMPNTPALIGKGISGLYAAELERTEAGTIRVKDISSGSASSAPSMFADLHGSLFMAAQDPVHGYEPHHPP